MRFDLTDATIERLAKAISDAITGAALKDDELVKIDELCSRLGVPKNTVYYWVKDKRFPVRRGRPLRFSVVAVKEWMRKK
jgi:excisionase family DNA binding protein